MAEKEKPRVRVEVAERIATVTIDRPEARNAIDKQTTRELRAALDDLADRDEAHVLILTGAGDKAFVSGADIAELKARKRSDALRGTEISTPFYMISPYDEAKVDEAGLAYQEVLTGTRPQVDMPEMTELFRTEAMPLLGFEAGAGLDAKGIVDHRCGTCHNGDFPGISRNNFDVADFPDNLSPAMRDKILLRITMPETSRFRMPPMIFSKLTDEQVTAIETAIHP